MYYNNSNLANLTFINIKAFETLAEIRKKLYYDSIKGLLGSILKEALGLITIPTKLGFVFNNLIKGIIEEDDLGEITLDYFRFKINPQNLQVDRKKIISTRYTGAGYDVDTRGEELIGMGYNGTTGSLVPKGLYMRLLREIESQLDLFKNVMLLNGVTGTIQNKINEICRNPKLSTAYLRFVLLEAYWQYANDDMLIIWEDNAYVGKFTNFSYKLDAQNPYQIMYNFNVQVYPEFKYNVATGWITNANYATIKSRFNRKNTTLDGGKKEETTTPVSVVTKGLEDIETLMKREVQKRVNVYESYYKEFENGFTDVGIIIDKLSDQEELEQWYASLGMFTYNKDKISFKEYWEKNKGEVEYVTPIDMMTYYRTNPGNSIDIFEEFSLFDKKQVMSIQKTETTNKTNTGSGKDAIKETQINNGNEIKLLKTENRPPYGVPKE